MALLLHAEHDFACMLELVLITVLPALTCPELIVVLLLHAGHDLSGMLELVSLLQTGHKV